MKSLDTLIKLHKRKIDELRKKLGALEKQKIDLEGAIRALQRELDEEIKLAGAQQEMARFFGDFAKRIKTRQQQIRDEIKSLEKEMVKIGEEIALEFAELKKFEIAKSNREKRARAEANRKETIALDDIAIQQFSRKEE